MALFLISNSDVFLHAKAKEEAAIREALTFQVPGWEWMVRNNPRLANWDGTKCFFDAKHGSFPAGLLPFVMKKMQKLGIECKIQDERTRLEPLDSGALNIWHERLTSLLDGRRPMKEKSAYQVDAVRRLLENRIEDVPWPRGLIDFATGSGKTLLAALLIGVLGRKTLFLVERLDLLAQTKNVFEEVLPTCVGRISEGDFEPEFTTVSTIQTITRLMGQEKVRRYLQSVEVVILDECHNLSGSRGEFRDRYLILLALLRNAYFRVGISATPLMRKDMGDIYLMGMFGDVVAELRAKDLSDRGLLARPQIKMVRIENSALSPVVHGRHIYLQGIVENEERNAIIVRLVQKAYGKFPTFVLVRLARHGQILRRMLREVGISAPFLNYKVDTRKRMTTVRKFNKGQVPVLLSSTIFDQGIDVKDLRFLIVASGGKSAIKTIQRLGRGMRKKEGSNVVYVADFFDEAHERLAENSTDRRAAYEAEGHMVKLLRPKGDMP